MKQYTVTRLRNGRRRLARVGFASLATIFGALSLAVVLPAATTSADTITNGRIYTGYSWIYSRNPDGSSVKTVASLNTVVSQYSFSPDGKKVAYFILPAGTTPPPASLVVANADMTGAVTIKSVPVQSLGRGGPSWSPDGQWLAYGSNVITSTNNSSSYAGYINLIKPDGTGARVVSGVTDLGSKPSWVNATTLLYRNIAAANEANTCVVSITTAAKSCYTTAVVNGYTTALLASPNGTQMAWLKLKSTQGGAADLFVSNFDGTNARQLTALPAGQSVSNFAWSPDGTRLAVLVYTTTNSQISNIALQTIQKDTGATTTIASGGTGTSTYGQIADNVAWQPVVVASPTPTPTPTPTPVPTTSGGSLIQTQYGSRCLDVDTNGGGVNGNKVQLWDCVGNANQRWTLNANGTISTHYGGRCLDVDTNGGGVNGNKVHLWDCVGGTNQRWIRNANGTLQNPYSGRCLDVDTNGGGVNGNKVQVWDCVGGANQRWNIVQ